MAYFNYYVIKKIIREIVNTLFRFVKKHKILSVIIFLFIIFSFKQCFCYEYTYDDITFDIPDTVDKFVITKQYTSGRWCLIYTKDGSDLKVYGKASAFFTIISKTGGTFYYRVSTTGTNTTDFTSLAEQSRTTNWSVFNTPIYRKCKYI